MLVFMIIPGPIGRLDGRIFSPLASVRLRCLEVAPYLVQLGHRIRPILDSDVATMVRDGSFRDADAYINFKTTYNFAPWFADLVDLGKPVIADICDNVFTGPDADAHNALLNVVTMATTPTNSLGEIIRDRGVPVSVIPDCLEGSGSELSVPPLGRELRLLWFGRRKNSAPLLASLAGIEAAFAERPLQLTVVCDEPDLLVNDVRRRAPRIATDGEEWSPRVVSDALAKCHAVLTPTSDDPEFVTKSPNRLTHALWHNRPVATQDFPGLGALKEFVAVADDMAAALQALIDDWPKTLARTQRGKAHVQSTVSPEVVARHWDLALREATTIAGGTRAMPGPKPKPAIRLNLGCGDKILPHYINVDLAPDRDGVKPDLVHDVRTLSTFETGSVDEVLSVHLIEHLNQWDVGAALSEWARVLRPGGWLVIECPNMLSACAALLDDPDAASDSQGTRAQRTMWAFYGSPAPGDPLMMHRWGYTPESLSKLLVEAGLVDIRSEEPRFKLGSPRDMRITGRKPA